MIRHSIRYIHASKKYVHVYYNWLYAEWKLNNRNNEDLLNSQFVLSQLELNIQPLLNTIITLFIMVYLPLTM